MRLNAPAKLKARATLFPTKTIIIAIIAGNMIKVTLKLAEYPSVLCVNRYTVLISKPSPNAQPRMSKIEPNVEGSVRVPVKSSSNILFYSCLCEIEKF
ncbi:hypothetical protein SDC9_153185 [bioreactor metagenome]|uniref:Uncharacterized protein n=1 Tax=bioreactor metagenome TaxID=1076179 RepID=A0A645EV72_9ZZZZ